MLNKDYKDMLQSLSEENVSFLLVGAYALAAHGYPRSTMDIDIWVKPVKRNAEAFTRSSVVSIDGLDIHIPSIDDLIVNKRATGRTKDIADAEALESIKSQTETKPAGKKKKNVEA